jgi:hypothetical protein
MVIKSVGAYVIFSPWGFEGTWFHNCQAIVLQLNSELYPLFIVIQFSDPHTCNDTLHVHITTTGKGTFFNFHGVITSIPKVVNIPN